MGCYISAFALTHDQFQCTGTSPDSEPLAILSSKYIGIVHFLVMPVGAVCVIFHCYYMCLVLHWHCSYLKCSMLFFWCRRNRDASDSIVDSLLAAEISMIALDTLELIVQVIGAVARNLVKLNEKRNLFSEHIDLK